MLKISKRFFGLLLTLCMLVGMAPISVLADSPEENGEVYTGEKSVIIIEEGQPMPRLDFFYFKGASGETVGIYKSSYFGYGYQTSGHAVKVVQSALTACGFSTSGIDGSWGPNTNSAAIRFQRSYSLTQDGIIGPSSLAVLENLVGASTGVRLKGI